MSAGLRTRRDRQHDEAPRPLSQERAPAQRPVVIKRQLFPGRVICRVREFVRGVMETVNHVWNISPEGVDVDVIEEHCRRCGAEFIREVSEPWYPDGTPKYTGGVIETKRWYPKLRKFYRIVQACPCAAGKPFRAAGMVDASPRAIHARDRLLRMQRRVFRRTATPEAISLAINTWPPAFVDRWGSEVSRLASNGTAIAEAKRLAFITVGNDLDARRLLP